MSIEDGTALAIQALHSAIRRDSASGGEMEVVIITEDTYETLSEERVKEIKSSLN
jgi:proteasome beta subunit